MNNNQLTGAIPSELYTVGDHYNSNETFIDLSNNLLEDSIPSSLGNSKSLKELKLAGNKLTGNIPSSFSNLNKLGVLNVAGNKLSGTLPAFLTAMPRLHSLNVNRNSYTFNGMETLAQHDFRSFKYFNERPISLHVNNNTLSVYAGGTLSNNTYNWYKDGSLVATIAGDSAYQPIAAGNYSVTVTNSIATELTLYSDTLNYIETKSIASSFSQNDINAANSKSILLYPNPAKTITNIAFAATGKYAVSIADLNGKVLQVKTGISASKQNYVQLNVSGFAAGIYVITITDESNKKQSLKLNKE